MPKVAQDVLVAFGATIKRERTARGWTLDALGTKMGGASSKSFLSNIEKGKRDISARTVGRLINTLDLNKSWIDQFLDETISDETEETQTDLNAEALLREKEALAQELKLSEALTIALAYKYAENNPTDLKGALAGLEVALETAQRMNAEAALNSNVSDAVDQVLARMKDLNDAGDLDAAADALDAALAEEAEAAKARRMRLLEIGLEQDVLRGNAESAAGRIIALAELDANDVYEWSEIIHSVGRDQEQSGRDKGRNFDLGVAITLYRHCSVMTVERPKQLLGLGDLANALLALGARESGTERLEQAVAAFRAALEERTRETVPLSWAMTTQNIALVEVAFWDKTKDQSHLLRAIDYATAAEAVYREADAAYYIEKNARLIKRIQDLQDAAE